MHRKTLVIMAVFIAVAAIPAFAAYKDVPDVVATVNGEKITKAQLTETLYDWDAPLIIEEIIDQRLIGQEARKLGINIKVEDIKARMEESKKMLPPGMTIDEALRRSGLTPGHWFARLKAEAQAREIVKRQIKITPEDLANQVKVSRILVRIPYKQTDEEKAKAKQEAQSKIAEAAQKIKEGLSFEDAAKQYSEDYMTKEKGGDMGFFAKNVQGKEFEEALAKLKPGEVSEPFESPVGFQIIKLIKTGTDTTGDERKELEERLINQQLGPKLNEWFLSLRNKAQITNYFAPPKPKEKPQEAKPPKQEQPPAPEGPAPGQSDAEAATGAPPPQPPAPEPAPQPSPAPQPAPSTPESPSPAK